MFVYGLGFLVGWLVSLAPGAPPFVALGLGLWSREAGLVAYAFAYSASAYKQIKYPESSGNLDNFSQLNLYALIGLKVLGAAAGLACIWLPPVASIAATRIVILLLMLWSAYRYGRNAILFFSLYSILLIVSQYLGVYNVIAAVGAALYLPSNGKQTAATQQDAYGVEYLSAGVIPTVLFSLVTPGLSPSLITNLFFKLKYRAGIAAIASSFIEFWNIRAVLIGAESAKSAAAITLLDFDYAGLGFILPLVGLLAGAIVGLIKLDFGFKFSYYGGRATSILIPIILGGWFVLPAVAIGQLFAPKIPHEVKPMAFMLPLLVL